MTIDIFAKNHRLKKKHDPQDDTDIIRGHDGQSHIFEYGASKLGVVFMPEDPGPRKWSAARRAFKAVGMKITQNGDCEGVATFDPEDPQQVRVAMTYADVRRRRELSRAHVEALAKGRTQWQRSRIPVQALSTEGVLACSTDDQALGWALESSAGDGR